MTRIFSYSLVFLLASGTLAAQPLRKNLCSDPVKTENRFSVETPLTMRDFRYQGGRSSSPSGLVQAMRTKPGVALLSSGLIPGLGQAANSKWMRAGAYFLADAILLAVHLRSRQRAKELQQQYEQFADRNWSVVTYAQWLVDYHKSNGIYSQNEHIDELEQQVNGRHAAYNPDIDWETVDLQTLREVERHTPFITPDGTAGNNFSHFMPEYGSQQYYELISKYYQYGPGWNDFGIDRRGEPLDSQYQLSWNGEDMPPHFFEGASLADQFNDKYRVAGNMLAYMLLNHVVSAFDAFITVKINNNRLETESSLFGARQFILKYHF
ncbi:hypothetical protein [Halalkalibaculum sp. DA384]|uniref:hypothetical protein n=1 Tax=Halalkalibaculum sp. DA384 TaxID=3373606 RepID=UPI0037546325